MRVSIRLTTKSSIDCWRMNVIEKVFDDEKRSLISIAQTIRMLLLYYMNQNSIF
jgi:hypothetical protein